MRLYAMLCVILTACSPLMPSTSEAPPLNQAADAPSLSGETMEQNNVRVSWSITAEGEDRVILYTVENHLSERLFVLDEMLEFSTKGQGLDKAPDGIIVRATSAAEPLHLFRGYVKPNGFPEVLLVPAARGVAPGESLAGRAVLHAPLHTWHPNERPQPLSFKPLRAVLQIGVLTGELPWDWQDLADGSKVIVAPRHVVSANQRWVTGETLLWP